jgi:uncharacterized protein YbaR (Trm112 family)
MIKLRLIVCPVCLGKKVIKIAREFVMKISEWQDWTKASKFIEEIECPKCHGDGDLIVVDER